MHLRLEGCLGTITDYCTGYRRQRSKSHLVLQWCLWCICLLVVSLGSLCCFGGQNGYLFGWRQQHWTQALSGSSCSFFSMFFTLSVCFALCSSFVCLLLQPASIEKTSVPEIHFSHHRLCSLTLLATPSLESVSTLWLRSGYRTLMNTLTGAIHRLFNTQLFSLCS